MRITAPAHLTERATKLFGQEVQTAPPDDGESDRILEERVEQAMKNKLPMGNTLGEDDVVERSEGEFLFLSRFSDDDMLYDIYGIVPAEKVLENLGKRPKGPLVGGDLSDMCVNAFDQETAMEFGFEHGRVAYRTKDGRFIHQHST